MAVRGMVILSKTRSLDQHRVHWYFQIKPNVQTDIQTERKKTDRQSDIQTNSQPARQINRLPERKTDR